MPRPTDDVGRWGTATARLGDPATTQTASPAMAPPRIPPSSGVVMSPRPRSCAEGPSDPLPRWPAPPPVRAQIPKHELDQLFLAKDEPGPAIPIPAGGSARGRGGGIPRREDARPRSPRR